MTYHFVLRLLTPCCSEDELVEKLGAAGCTDSLVGLGEPGLVVLAFEREGESLDAALSGAIAQVRRAFPGVCLMAYL